MGLFDFLRRKPKESNVVEIETSRSRTINKLVEARKSAASWGMGAVGSILHDSISDRLSKQKLYSMSLQRMRIESRRIYWASNVAKASIKRISENAINNGLKLQSTPQWNLLTDSKDAEAQKEWTQNTESRFRLWADSTNPDSRQQKNLYQLQTQAFGSLLKDGEFFAILRYSKNQRLQNPLTIQLVDPCIVQDVTDKKLLDALKARGNTTSDGIEYDKNGGPVAYYFTDMATMKQVRIERVGARTGRLFVLHGFIPEWPGQGRGIPVLTGVIRDLQKLADYEAAELAAAVINASIAVWIEPSDKKASSKPFKGIQLKDPSAQQEAMEEVVENPFNEGLFDKPTLIVQNLKAGEKMNSYDTKRPNVEFDKFISAVKKNIASSLSIPVEVLDQLFGKNFSASRASLVMYWNTINIWRSEFSAMFNKPVYEHWMDGERSGERIKADGWNEPIKRQAWINSQWVGISKPSIDPVKEAKASSERISQGTTTREREAQEYNGTSFDDNIERLKIENRELAEAEQYLTQSESPTGDSDTEGDDDETTN